MHGGGRDPNGRSLDDEIRIEQDSTQPIGINDIMDVGGDYGEEVQGTETGGAVINETEFLHEVAQFEGHVGGPPPFGQTSRKKVGPLDFEAIPVDKLKSWGWD